MNAAVANTEVTVVGASSRRQRGMDQVAVEGPLEIRVNGRGYAVTMRTPGDDLDLTAGFLVSEGLVVGTRDLGMLHVPEHAEGDVVDAEVSGAGALVALDRHRNVYTSSSCGVCGLASIDSVRTTSRFDLTSNETTALAGTISELPARLRLAQGLFDSTGGAHAAGLFTAAGEGLVVREDVGRHNAVDKVVGWAARRNRLPLDQHILQVSGRASFELVQKAAMAGIPVLTAVSAPSSLAIDLADAAGITLVGFSRGSSFNIYTHGGRVIGENP